MPDSPQKIDAQNEHSPDNLGTDRLLSINLLEAREKSCVHNVIAFGFTSHCLKNWHEVVKQIAKPSNSNRVITVILKLLCLLPMD